MYIKTSLLAALSLLCAAAVTSPLEPNGAVEARGNEATEKRQGDIDGYYHGYIKRQGDINGYYHGYIKRQEEGPAEGDGYYHGYIKREE